MSISTLVALWAGLAADKYVESSEVTTFSETLLADGKVDESEANTIFEIQTGLETGGEYAEVTFEDGARAEFDNVCVNGIRDYLIGDNDLSESEFAWLKAKIEADGQYSDFEKALVQSILDAAPTMSDEARSYLESIVASAPAAVAE